MLCRFGFKNFKSFRDESVLEMKAADISEHQDTLIVDKADKEKFLPLAVIYGTNGGGKSNVLSALMYLEKIVLNPIVSLRETQNNVNDLFLGNLVLGKMSLKKMAFDKLNSYSFRETDIYFKFDKVSHDLPIEFHISFRFKKQEFKYRLNVLKGKILRENFYCRDLLKKSDIIVFNRDENGISMDDLDSINLNKNDVIKDSIPLLSYISITKNIPMIDNAVEWFFKLFQLNYDHPLRDRAIFASKNKRDEDFLLNMLSELNINISGIRTVTDDRDEIVDVYLKHKLNDGSEVELLFEEESSGTRKLFGMLPFVIESLKGGNLVIADEFDAKLHPEILRYVIKLFANPKINKKGAQLIFTSHDLSTMKKSIFRRDEIWFAVLNEYNSSELISLVDLRNQSKVKSGKDGGYAEQDIDGFVC